ncbi:hypothetical protein IWQ61_004374 [Dispira simplex]|nr:hypothetical protein IWQ61_004374 [Dispira simplex]
MGSEHNTPTNSSNGVDNAHDLALVRAQGLQQTAQHGANAVLHFLLQSRSVVYEQKVFQKAVIQLGWSLLTRTLDYLLQYLDHEESKFRALPTEQRPKESLTALANGGLSLKTAMAYDRWREKQAHSLVALLVLLKALQYKARMALTATPATSDATGIQPAGESAKPRGKFRFFIPTTLLTRLITRLVTRYLEDDGAPGELLPAALKIMCFITDNAGIVPDLLLPDDILHEFQSQTLVVSSRKPSLFAVHVVLVCFHRHDTPRLLCRVGQRHDEQIKALVLCILRNTWRSFTSYLAHPDRLSLFIDWLINDHRWHPQDQRIPADVPIDEGNGSGLGALYQSDACTSWAETAALLVRLGQANPTAINQIPMSKVSLVMERWRVVVHGLPLNADHRVPTVPQRRLFSYLTDLVVFMCQQLSVNCSTFNKLHGIQVCADRVIQISLQVLEVSQRQYTPARSHFRWLWGTLGSLIKLINVNMTQGIYFNDCNTISECTFSLLKVFVAHHFINTRDTQSDLGQLPYQPPPVPGQPMTSSASPQEALWELADRKNWEFTRSPWEKLADLPETSHPLRMSETPEGSNSSRDLLGITLPAAIPLIKEIIKLFGRCYNPTGWHSDKHHDITIVLFSLFTQIHHIIIREPPLQASLSDNGKQYQESGSAMSEDGPRLVPDIHPATDVQLVQEVRKIRTILLRLFSDLFRNSVTDPLEVFPQDTQILAESSQILLSYVFQGGRLPDSSISTETTSALPHRSTTGTQNETNARSELDPTDHLRLESLRALVSMAKHYQWRMHLAVAPSGLAFLHYNVTVWLMTNFRGGHSRPTDYTLRQAELLMHYCCYMFQEAIVRDRFRSNYGLARFFSLSYASAISWAEKPTTNRERDILQVILLGLFKGFQCFQRDVPLLRTFYQSPYPGLTDSVISRNQPQRPSPSHSTAAPSAEMSDVIQWDPLSLAVSPCEWWLTSARSRRLGYMAINREGRLSFLTCLIHILTSWTTTGTVAHESSVASISQQITRNQEYLTDAFEEEVPSGQLPSLPMEIDRPGSPLPLPVSLTTPSSAPRDPTLTASSARMRTTSSHPPRNPAPQSTQSFRDTILYQSATMFKQLLMVPECLAWVASNVGVLRIIARRWRDSKYDTDNIGKLLLHILSMCLSSPHWLDIVQQDILTSLFAELLGISEVQMPTEVNPHLLSPGSKVSPPTVVSYKPSLTTSGICHTSPGSIRAKVSWVPNLEQLRELLATLNGQISATYTLVSYVAEDKSLQAQTLRERTAKALVYCCPPTRYEELLISQLLCPNVLLIYPGLDNSTASRAGLPNPSCPLGMLFATLLSQPSARSEILSRVTPDCFHPLEALQIPTEGTYSYFPLQITAGSSDSSNSLPIQWGTPGSRCVSEGWGPEEAHRIRSACQAVEFLAWQQQTRYVPCYRSVQRKLIQRIQSQVSELVNALPPIRDTFHIAVTCTMDKVTRYFCLLDELNTNPINGWSLESLDSQGDPLRVLELSTLLEVNDRFQLETLCANSSVAFVFNTEVVQSGRTGIPLPSWNITKVIPTTIVVEVPLTLATTLSPVFRAMFTGKYREAHQQRVVMDHSTIQWCDFLDLCFCVLQFRRIVTGTAQNFPWNQAETEDFTELIQGGYYDSPTPPSASVSPQSTTSQPTRSPAASNSDVPSSVSNATRYAHIFLSWLFPIDQTPGHRIRRLMYCADYYLMSSIVDACQGWMADVLFNTACTRWPFIPTYYSHNPSSSPSRSPRNTGSGPSYPRGTPPGSVSRSGPPATRSLINDASVFSGVSSTLSPGISLVVGVGQSQALPQSMGVNTDGYYEANLVMWFKYYAIRYPDSAMYRLLLSLILLDFTHAATLDAFLCLLWAPELEGISPLWPAMQANIVNPSFGNL